jgi:nucleoside-diphosphate-sugar epimerase
VNKAHRTFFVCAYRAAAPPQGDLADDAALRAGAAGADAVFHCAWSGLDMRGDLSALRRNNVDGLACCARAAAAAGVRRFVFVSSEAVLFGTRIVEADERAPVPCAPSDFIYKGGHNPYSVTKREAERWLLEGEGASLGMEIVIVRPRLLWGRDDSSVTPQLVALARSGVLALMGGGGARTSSCHVDNAVEGLLRAATRGRPGQARVRHACHARACADFCLHLFSSYPYPPLI